MSSYTSNTPQPNENPSDSQDKFLNNFLAISDLISQNHVQFNSGVESGKHKFLQMPEQGSAPTTIADEGALYTKVKSGNTELFYRGEGNGSEKQMTTSRPNGSDPARDWSFADGLQLRFGTLTHTGTSTPITFSSSFSNQAFTVLLTPIGAAGLVSGVNTQSLGSSGFSIHSTSSGGGNSFYYVAFGR